MNRKISKAWLFLTFPLIGIAIFTMYPLFFGVYLSLFGQRGPRMWFVGLYNYITVLEDPSFWGGFGLPIFILLVQVPIMLGIAVVLALILDSGRLRYPSIYRTFFFMPYAVPTVVSGLIWGYMFSSALSPFIPLLKSFGINVNFLSSGSLPWVMLNIMTWEWAGYNLVLIYSTLLSIPKEISEQARIDGASDFQTALYIKLPLLKTTLLILFIFSIIGSLQIFNEPMMLSGITNIPPNFTPSMYVYNQAFSYGSFTYATTAAIILGAIIFVFSFFFLRLSMKQLEENIE